MLLLFPHQLYAKEFWPSGVRRVTIVEDPLFFDDPNTRIVSHRQKIMLHRASMRAFADELVKDPELGVNYLEFFKLGDGEGLYRWLANQGVRKIEVFELNDYLLEQRLKRYTKKYAIEVTEHRSPNFMTVREEGLLFLRKMKKPLLADFYKWQRIRSGVLMNGQQPVGGRWSFDLENRKRMSREAAEEAFALDLGGFFPNDKYRTEAVRYARRYFGKAVGVDNLLMYPITREEAWRWLRDFLTKCLASFGDYEDAIIKDQSRLFHSVLSPIMNIGLIQPAEVVSETMDYARMSIVPINSLEGFLRQIIGWREFMRLIYLEYGTKARNQNFLGQHENCQGVFGLAQPE